MIAWMAYAALVGAVIAVGGVALERLAAATGRPRRFAWLAALTLAVVIPLAGGWHGPAPVETVVPYSAATGGVVVGDVWRAIPALPVPEGMDTGRVAALAWGAGSLASLAVLGGVLVLVARGRRRWKRSRVLGADVYVSRRFGPALVGVARPKVVIPSWVLQLKSGARDAIIRHEAEHARARDHLTLLYGGLVAAVFPWSPAIWWMYRRLRAAVELDCDQRVLASGIGVADYGDVLLSAGSRSRGCWGFAPAMGQPESLLERRLKTMSEKQRKLSGGYGALLVAMAGGAVVVACDTPVPTEVREAFEEVMADETAQGAEGERTDRVEVFLKAGSFGSGPGPMLFVDGVRIRTEADLPTSVSEWFGDRSMDAADIDRVEVIKGPAAAELYGEEGAGGVIQVFTKGADGEREHLIVTSAKRRNRTAEIAVTGTVNVGEPGAAEGAAVRGITVTGVARQEPEVEVIEIPPPLLQFVKTRQGMAADRAEDWDMWISESVVAKAPSGWRPVVYVDGVRVDGGAAGLKDLLPALDPGRIDRIEVGRGEVAERRYGKEGANGVIHIYTRKKSSEVPVPEAGKDGRPSAKGSPAGSP